MTVQELILKLKEFDGSCTVKLVTAKDKSGLTIRDFTVGRHRSLILVQAIYV